MQPFKEITVATARMWLNDKTVRVIDVREDEEFTDEHILCTLHVPLSRLDAYDIPQEGISIIAFICRSGKRSQVACDRVRDDISDTITLYSVEGGILEWKKAGFPTMLKGCI
jgi:rhodanese-related sulfurtransferase